MLLSPEHFIRQERYVDSLMHWKSRYTSNEWGLVGGGPRLPESERGSIRHDPVVVVDQDETSVGIAVTQARGITPAGYIVEIDPQHPVVQRFSRADLAGIADARVHIVCDPANKIAVDGETDDFNPQIKNERIPSYRIALQLHAHEVDLSLPVARIRKPAQGAGYEKDGAYIPPCTTLVGYSELTAAWKRILETAMSLADRYAELYRAMLEFLSLAEERGIGTLADRQAASFVERVMVSLQDTVYQMVDPVQSPAVFFRRLRHFLRSTAILLDLMPGVQQYFDGLKETGETEFTAPLEQQKRFAQMSRALRENEDLASEVRSVLQALRALQQLEYALEGKYIDFRISTILEGMNFVFDRGGKVLYRLAARPARVQGQGEEVAIYFSNLRLEGREKYRLVLVGERNHRFDPGYRISTEIRLNEGSGFRREPIHLSAECTIPGQRNFEMDFDAADVATITEVRVMVDSHQPIRTALLYTRHRFYGLGVTGASPAESPADRNMPAAPRTAERWPGAQAVDGAPGRDERGYGVSPRLQRERTSEAEADIFAEDLSAPWEQRHADPPPDAASHGVPPPRRRRLE
jgi:hypothetical protein